MKKNEKNWEDNWEEKTLIQIGARVPGDFAKIFTAYCGKNRFVNQRELFYNLAKWWYLQDPIIQEHVCRDRIPEALSRISEEVQAQAAAEDESGAASDSSKKKRKQSRKSSKSA